jgi:hypothetical protein
MWNTRIPVATFAAFLVLAVVLAPWPHLVERLLAGETGFVELITVFFALYGAWTAVRIVIERDRLPKRALALWYGLFALGLFVLAGEEVSWGQSLFGWQTPESYAAINRQQETNLHNLHSMAESLPKGMLVLAALVGGVVWPLVARRRKLGPVLPGTLGWIWPSTVIWPAAALTLVTRVGERILVWTDLEDVAYGQYDALRESIELFAVLYVLAYLHDVRARMAERAARA